MTSSIKPAQVRITTGRYIFSHAKEPKGFGLWVFETPGGTHSIRARGSFGDAKKQAAKEAAKVGLSELSVAP